MVAFTLNGREVESRYPEDTPLLWVLREEIGLQGTKFGCGIGQCGACTVHLNGVPVRSCQTPVGGLDGARVKTIEGLTEEARGALQEAWVEEQVPQCGYCQSGQLMSAAALLASDPMPSDEAIDEAMSGNICRCGTYGAIRRAIHRAAEAEAIAVETDGTAGGDR
jgi:isoquinoline 1-oxidoreductase subunit alpha